MLKKTHSFQRVIDKEHSSSHIQHLQFSARVVKLADTPDLGSGAVRREGSSPSPSSETIKAIQIWIAFFVHPDEGTSSDACPLPVAQSPTCLY